MKKKPPSQYINLRMSLGLSVLLQSQIRSLSHHWIHLVYNKVLIFTCWYTIMTRKKIHTLLKKCETIKTIISRWNGGSWESQWQLMDRVNIRNTCLLTVKATWHLLNYASMCNPMREKAKCSLFFLYQKDLALNFVLFQPTDVCEHIYM